MLCPSTRIVSAIMPEISHWKYTRQYNSSTKFELRYIMRRSDVKEVHIFSKTPLSSLKKRVLFLWKKENGVWNAIPFLGIKGPLLSFQLINYPNRITLRSTPTRVPSDKNVFPGLSSSHLFGSTRLRTHVKPQAVGRGWFLFGHHLNATENNKTGWTERKDDSYQ